MHEYRVVPFRATAKTQDARGAAQVAEQLQHAIQEHVNAGWEFVRVEQVQMQINPGCIAALLGARANVVPLDQIVFRMPKAKSE